MSEENAFIKDEGKLTNCEKCGGRLTYKGVGEYVCDECHVICYDAFGKVRNYIEEHRGANIAEISRDTHVSTAMIRQFVRDERLSIAANSAIRLHCELCGADISSGYLCLSCKSRHAGWGEMSQSSALSRGGAKGVSTAAPKGDAHGTKRFNR